MLGYRYAPYQAGTMRLVLNVSGPVRVREAFVLPPRDGKQPRFVLDLEPVSPAVFASEMNKVRGIRVAEQSVGAAYTLPVATAAAVGKQGGPEITRTADGYRRHHHVAGGGRGHSASGAAGIALQRAGDDAASAATLAALGVVPLPPKRPSSRTDARRVIVLDPGHGGVDPGAMSVAGTFEKDLTLAMARVSGIISPPRGATAWC